MQEIEARLERTNDRNKREKFWTEIAYSLFSELSRERNKEHWKAIKEVSRFKGGFKMEKTKTHLCHKGRNLENKAV